MDNKLTGSFYTPQKLIEYMAKYISGRITPRSILEPSAGDGRFVPAISIFDCPVTAVELYKEKADALHTLSVESWIERILPFMLL